MGCFNIWSTKLSLESHRTGLLWLFCSQPYLQTNTYLNYNSTLIEKKEEDNHTN